MHLEFCFNASSIWNIYLIIIMYICIYIYKRPPLDWPQWTPLIHAGSSLSTSSMSPNPRSQPPFHSPVSPLFSPNCQVRQASPWTPPSPPSILHLSKCTPPRQFLVPVHPRPLLLVPPRPPFARSAAVWSRCIPQTTRVSPAAAQAKAEHGYRAITAVYPSSPRSSGCPPGETVPLIPAVARLALRASACEGCARRAPRARRTWPRDRTTRAGRAPGSPRPRAGHRETLSHKWLCRAGSAHRPLGSMSLSPLCRSCSLARACTRWCSSPSHRPPPPPLLPSLRTPPPPPPTTTITPTTLLPTSLPTAITIATSTEITIPTSPSPPHQLSPLRARRPSLRGGGGGHVVYPGR